MTDVSRFIVPDWQVPAHVNALSTTRKGGISQGAFSSNNLALHVNDMPSVVEKNRALLRKNAGLTVEPVWLTQTHSATVVDIGDEQGGAMAGEKAAEPVRADASFSSKPGKVCVVMTADCLPLLLCDKKGTQVAAIHAGWRGLLNGIIENTVNMFSVPGADIIAWFGPAIGPKAFEVGREVKELFVNQDIDALKAFRQCSEDKWLANIYALAAMRLKNLGVAEISGGQYCTFRDGSRFYSYRRDQVCGRMATLVWLDK